MVIKDEFISYSDRKSGRFGTARKAIQDIQMQNKIAVLDIDLNACKKFAKFFPDTNFMFFCPPSVSA